MNVHSTRKQWTYPFTTGFCADELLALSPRVTFQTLIKYSFTLPRSVNRIAATRCFEWGIRTTPLKAMLPTTPSVAVLLCVVPLPLHLGERARSRTFSAHVSLRCLYTLRNFSSTNIYRCSC